MNKKGHEKSTQPGQYFKSKKLQKHVKCYFEIEYPTEEAGRLSNVCRVTQNH